MLNFGQIDPIVSLEETILSVFLFYSRRNYCRSVLIMHQCPLCFTICSMSYVFLFHYVKYSSNCPYFWVMILLMQQRANCSSLDQLLYDEGVCRESMFVKQKNTKKKASFFEVTFTKCSLFVLSRNAYFYVNILKLFVFLLKIKFVHFLEILQKTFFAPTFCPLLRDTSEDVLRPYFLFFIFTHDLFFLSFLFKEHRFYETDSEREIQSPSYLNSYDASLNYHWTTTVPEGKRIEVSLEDFDVEYAKNCDKDFLKIYDGCGTNDPVLKSLCGRRRPESFISSGRYLYIHFRSDSSRT